MGVAAVFSSMIERRVKFKSQQWSTRLRLLETQLSTGNDWYVAGMNEKHWANGAMEAASFSVPSFGLLSCMFLWCLQSCSSSWVLCLGSRYWWPACHRAASAGLSCVTPAHKPNLNRLARVCSCLLTVCVVRHARVQLRPPSQFILSRPSWQKCVVVIISCWNCPEMQARARQWL